MLLIHQKQSIKSSHYFKTKNVVVLNTQNLFFFLFFRRRVPLEPFVHQVGGHFPMVCLAKETLCKPLNEREHKFYKTMGKTLIPFVPRYEGTMRVEVHEDDLGIPHHMFYKKEITKILCFVFLRKSKSTKKNGYIPFGSAMMFQRKLSGDPRGEFLVKWAKQRVNPAILNIEKMK